MSKVSGLFQDLTAVKAARNGRFASRDQRGKNQADRGLGQLPGLDAFPEGLGAHL